MVAVFNKELLSWYLITLKLKETVEANLPKSSAPATPTSSDLGAGPPAQPPLLLLTQGGEEGGGERSPPSPRIVRSPTPPPPPPPTAGGGDSEWVISIREKLEQARQADAACPWAKLCIYRVPKSLREGDEKSYVPQVVSLGPFHHGRRRLRDMEPHKWRALHRVLKRTGRDVRAYLDAVRPLEDRVRACYEGRARLLPSRELVLSLVLDGTFALELFRGAAGEGGFPALGYSRRDPVFAMRGAMHAVQRDMIMLENQIPLFVLDRLLAVQSGRPPDQTGLVAPLAVRFFDPLMPTDEPPLRRPPDRGRVVVASSAEFDPLSGSGLHCLDVFRQSLLRAGPQPAPPSHWRRRWSQTRRVADRRRQQLIHCVSELREAGIRCRRRSTDRFWDVAFEDGVLRIPRILIHDGTRSLFLNLIAFEQCHVDTPSTITSYVIFMDNLINSEDDVRYLHQRGIIEHWLGNEREVADLFNRLCQEVVFDINDSYLSALSEQVNRHYSHKWSTWTAALKHNYFGNPWAIISFVAAAVLLLLTFTQTFYSVYTYYRPIQQY